jgi:hypothetical protein
MREPYVSLFIVALPILVLCILNIVKKEKIGFQSGAINIILLVASSVVVILCIVVFILTYVKGDIILPFWPSYSIFILVIVMFITGIVQITIIKRNYTRIEHVAIYSGLTYSLVIIVWRIVGFVIS